MCVGGSERVDGGSDRVGNLSVCVCVCVCCGGGDEGWRVCVCVCVACPANSPVLIINVTLSFSG